MDAEPAIEKNTLVITPISSIFSAVSTDDRSFIDYSANISWVCSTDTNGNSLPFNRRRKAKLCTRTWQVSLQSERDRSLIVSQISIWLFYCDSLGWLQAEKPRELVQSCKKQNKTNNPKRCLHPMPILKTSVLPRSTAYFVRVYSAPEAWRQCFWQTPK